MYNISFDDAKDCDDGVSMSKKEVAIEGNDKDIDTNETTTIVEKDYTMRLKGELYRLVRDHCDKNNITMKDYVNGLIEQDLKYKVKFQKFLAPDLSLEHVSERSLFIYDAGLDRTATIKVKWHKLEDKQTGIYVFCELCNSDSCLHVKYSLTLTVVYSMRKEGHISDTFAHNSNHTVI